MGSPILKINCLGRCVPGISTLKLRKLYPKEPRLHLVVISLTLFVQGIKCEGLRGSWKATEAKQGMIELQSLERPYKATVQVHESKAYISMKASRY